MWPEQKKCTIVPFSYSFSNAKILVSVIDMKNKNISISPKNLLVKLCCEQCQPLHNTFDFKKCSADLI